MKKPKSFHQVPIDCKAVSVAKGKKLACTFCDRTGTKTWKAGDPIPFKCRRRQDWETDLTVKGNKFKEAAMPKMISENEKRKQKEARKLDKMVERLREKYKLSTTDAKAAAAVIHEANQSKEFLTDLRKFGVRSPLLEDLFANATLKHLLANDFWRKQFDKNPDIKQQLIAAGLMLDDRTIEDDIQQKGAGK